MKFLSPEVALINLPYGHAWNTVAMPAPSCYLELLGKLQKWVWQDC